MKVVISEPPKKLSEWFISNENSDLCNINIWCFDQDTANRILIDAQIQQPISEIVLEPIKI